jgi:hypothetical protein
MSKASVDTNLSQKLILKAETVELAQKVRHHLVMNSEFTWFFVYNTGDVYATNDFGGHLEDSLYEKLKVMAKEKLDSLKMETEFKPNVWSSAGKGLYV